MERRLAGVSEKAAIRGSGPVGGKGRRKPDVVVASHAGSERSDVLTVASPE